MTPTRFRIVKHLTATLFALAAAGILVLGFDGLLKAMRKLTLVITTPPPAAAPAAEAPMSPGVVPAFVVPAEEAAPAGPAGSARD